MKKAKTLTDANTKGLKGIASEKDWKSMSDTKVKTKDVLM